MRIYIVIANRYNYHTQEDIPSLEGAFLSKEDADSFVSNFGYSYVFEVNLMDVKLSKQSSLQSILSDLAKRVESFTQQH